MRVTLDCRRPVGKNPHMSDAPSPRLKLKAQVYLGDDVAMGPGKADLLEAIISEGSISAAGRKLGMSYRRTWLLVDTMNSCFIDPLVETATGGNKGGGAHVTARGQEILRLYRQLEAEMNRVRDGATAREIMAQMVPSRQAE